MIFQKHAIECDKSACSTNDPTYYERAQANYEKAIEFFNKSLDLEQDHQCVQLLRHQIAKNTERCSVMRSWIREYRTQQERETIARKASRLPIVFPYDPPGDISDDESLLEEDILPPTPITPVSLPSRTPRATPEPPHAMLEPSREPSKFPLESSETQGQTPEQQHTVPKPSPRSDIDALTAEIVSLLTSNSDRPKAHWDSVAGLSLAKEVLQEATTLPHELPFLFGRDRQRWKSILLYGPPGCGKRVLAEAAAAAYDAPFLAPRVQDLLDLMGTSGAAGVRALFARAKSRGRAVLYISELEEVLGISLGGSNSMKFRQARAQLLDELLALRKDKDDDDGLLFVGATRIPWELDDALLSRVERRVYVGLPDVSARGQILEVGLRDVAHDITLQEIEYLAKDCEGYTPCDLVTLVRDAVMEPVRMIRNAEYFKKVTVEKGGRKITKRMPCDRDATGAIEVRFNGLNPNEIQAPMVKCLHFDLAMTSTKPSVSRDMIAKYLSFTEKKGLDGS